MGFVNPWWRAEVEDLERETANGFPADFLQLDTVLRNMCYGDAVGAYWEYRYLKASWSPQALRGLLHVEEHGRPWPQAEYDLRANQGLIPEVLAGIPSWTTRTTIHHLYHWTKWMDVTGRDLCDVPRIVEWGGGWGNMAKLAYRIAPKVTYTIIDLPTVSRLQAHYLDEVLPHATRQLTAGDAPHRERVNLVGLPALDCVRIAADLFVSTWALCESTVSAQTYVAEERKWFGAEHFLIATQRSKAAFPDATDFWTVVEQLGRVVPAVPQASAYVLA